MLCRYVPYLTLYVRYMYARNVRIDCFIMPAHTVSFPFSPTYLPGVVSSKLIRPRGASVAQSSSCLAGTTQ